MSIKLLFLLCLLFAAVSGYGSGGGSSNSAGVVISSADEVSPTTSQTTVDENPDDESSLQLAQPSCKGRAFGEIMPDPSHQCVQHYYICMGGVQAESRPCARGTYFDKERFTCNYMQKIIDCGAPTTTPSTTTTTTTPAPTTTEPEKTDDEVLKDFVCAKQGVFPASDVKSGCTNRYVVCNHQLESHVGRCVLGKYFHPRWHFCLAVRYVPECKDVALLLPPPASTTTTTTTTHAPLTQSQVLVDLCVDGNEIGHVVPDVLCAPYFYKCSHGKAFRTNCPLRLSYDQDLDRCIPMLHNPYCENNPCRGQKSGVQLRDSSSACKHYIVCRGGYPQRKNCPLSTLYSDSEGKCSSDPKKISASCIN